MDEQEFLSNFVFPFDETQSVSDPTRLCVPRVVIRQNSEISDGAKFDLIETTERAIFSLEKSTRRPNGKEKYRD